MPNGTIPSCRCRSRGAGPAATTTARLPWWGTGPAGALDTRGTSHGHQEYDRVKAGKLARDVIAVLRFQGPKAIGMPELHKLTPPLATLQAKGFAVGLVTDGRMSGASGKVPAAIQVTPEAKLGGALARVRDGDIVRLDAERGTLELLVNDATLHKRNAREPLDADAAEHGCGRELFSAFRRLVGTAESGASPLQQTGVERTWKLLLPNGPPISPTSALC